jgi:hypothetical protein
LYQFKPFYLFHKCEMYSWWKIVNSLPSHINFWQNLFAKIIVIELA